MSDSRLWLRTDRHRRPAIDGSRSRRVRRHSDHVPPRRSYLTRYDHNALAKVKPKSCTTLVRIFPASVAASIRRRKVITSGEDLSPAIQPLRAPPTFGGYRSEPALAAHRDRADQHGPALANYPQRVDSWFALTVQYVAAEGTYLAKGIRRGGSLRSRSEPLISKRWLGRPPATSRGWGAQSTCP